MATKHIYNTVTYLGVCVTYGRVLDWWPDLLHTYTTCYCTSQTTIWHAMSCVLIIFDLRLKRLPPFWFSESELLYNWRLTADQLVLAPTPWDPRPVFLFQMSICGYSPYATSSLKRGWICRLQLLLVLASTVILGSESPGTHDHILLSQIRNSPNLEGQVPYLYPPGTRRPSYIPRHWVPFRRLLRFVGPLRRYSNPPSYGILPAVSCLRSSLYSLGADPQKTPSLNDSSNVERCRGNVFTEQMPSNGCFLWLHYSSFQASCHNIFGCSLLNAW
jgi:hypothetical protein